MTDDWWRGFISGGITLFIIQLLMDEKRKEGSTNE